VYLSERLLQLLGAAKLGDRIGPATLTSVSSELGLRLTFEAQGRALHVEVALAEEERPFAARTPRLTFAYRSGEGEAEVDPDLGLELCRRVAALAAHHEEAVLVAIATDASLAREASDGTLRVREVVVERLLEPSGSANAPYWTLSPYVGCLVGCRFCYAQRRVAGVRRLERLPEVPWGSYVDVRVNAPDVLERELSGRAVSPIKFCPIVSDPYQAVEARYLVTRRCLEVIARAPSSWPVLILTRSILVQRDVDVLAALPVAYAGMSIPTIDDEVAKHFEPRAAPVAQRLATLRELRSSGVRTFAVVQPFLPGAIDLFADALAEVAASVSIDVLHGAYGAASDFADARYAHALDPSWQTARAEELRALLRTRGVAVWASELPDELRSRRDH
jgi:DNA repair photolyase